MLTDCMVLSQMASFSRKFSFVLLISSLFLHAALAKIVCEDIPKDMCAFAVASSGNRCALETSISDDGSVEYQCRTSKVVAEKLAGNIESDRCIETCGVDRKWVGISSDAFLETQFTTKLCSAECYQNCPNIADLYFNLAAAEGVYLPDICELQRANPHRSMIELLSFGAALGPESSLDGGSPVSAPSPAPL